MNPCRSSATSLRALIPRLPGFVACGRVSENEQGAGRRTERFFAVVPGNFAILDRDGDSLLDVYWKRYGC